MMGTHARRLKESLDDKIEILNTNALEASPAKEIFITVSAILALIRDNMIHDEDSVRLSEYCFNVCETLKNVTQWKNADDFDESGDEKTALENLKRVMREIEGSFRREAGTSRIKHSKEEVESCMLEVQRTLGAFNALNSSPSACRRLIRRAFAPHELPSLVETILSNKDEDEIVNRLPANDAILFIDVIDEILDTAELLPWIRKKCLKLLYRTCGYHCLLPRALKVLVDYDKTSDALYRGGYADVWKGECCGQDVAVKVIRTYSKSVLQKVIHKFCKEAVVWKFLRHPNVLPLIGVVMTETRFAMVSVWMENGNINEFIAAHPEADRLLLLVGVANGLIYLHNNGMIHGDLKGANILIDEASRACLADFGLLTIMSDPANLIPSSSQTQGGTVRWMSPELVAPEKYGFKKGHLTRSSDCYALGMVIYETISGNVPFHEHSDISASVKVMLGEHPTRGEVFPEHLWKVMESCWASTPEDRPSIGDVLRCLEGTPSVSEPPFLGDEQVEKNGDLDSSGGSSAKQTITNNMTITERKSMPALRSPGSQSTIASDSPEPHSYDSTSSPREEVAQTELAREQPPDNSPRPHPKPVRLGLARRIFRRQTHEKKAKAHPSPSSEPVSRTSVFSWAKFGTGDRYLPTPSPLESQPLDTHRKKQVLLLGSGDSGKSTILKQMLLFCKVSFSPQEVEKYRQLIFENLTNGLKCVLKAMEAMELKVADDNAKYLEVVAEAPGLSDGEPFPIHLLEPFKALWADVNVQTACSRGNEAALPENLYYYFSDLKRLFDPHYTPNEQDIIRCRVHTTGIAEVSFSLKDYDLVMVDVGGQRGERRKWIHCFQDVTCIVFVVNLSGYDQCLVEDRDANQMQDAMTLWDSICHSQWFKRTSIILLLNKNDLFEEKIQHSPIRNFFPDYEGKPGDAQAGREYFRRRFARLAQKANAKEREIYIHITCSIDINILRIIEAFVEK